MGLSRQRWVINRGRTVDRSNIYDTVRVLAQRPNLKDTDLDSCLGLVQSELNRELKKHPRNITRAEYTVPITDVDNVTPLPDTNLLALPWDIASLKAVADPSGVQLAQWPLAKADQAEYGNYIDRGDVLEIAGTTNIRGQVFCLDYARFIPDLVSPDSTNWITDYMPDLYIYGLLKCVAVLTKNRDALAGWSQQFAAVLLQTQTQGWDQNWADGGVQV